MKRTRVTFISICLALVCTAAAVAQLEDLGPLAPKKAAFNDSRDQVKVSLLSGRSRVAPGADFPVAVVFDHSPGWHIHTNAPVVPPELGTADSVIKTQIIATVETPGVLALIDAIQWPKVQNFKVSFGSKPVDYGVFGGRAIAYVPVTVSKETKPGPVTIVFTVTFQACDDLTCLAPAEVELKATFDVVEAGGAVRGGEDAVEKHVDFKGFSEASWLLTRNALANPAKQDAVTPAKNGAPVAEAPVLFSAFGLSFTLNPSSFADLALLLLVAAVGGLALNFMPCVLPVIPIKILSLTKAAGSRGKALALGAMMSLGVIVFWLALGVIVSLLNVFEGPSEIFSYPQANIIIGVFIAIMGLGMLGLFSARLPNWVYNFSPKHDSFLGSFGFGVLTAVLATPCTAPFMGTALGWAVKQPAAVSLAVFGAIGVGMAVPYLVLAAFPKLVDKLPRTGPANELLKQVMGLLMMAAGAYFLGVGIATLFATPGEPISQLYWLPVLLLLAASGLWMTLQIAKIQKWPVGPIIFAALGLMLLSVSLRGAANVVFPPRHEAVLDADGKRVVRPAANESSPINWVLFTPERFADARKQGRVLVVDFTAEWCINCKVLEATVLEGATVRPLLNDPDVVAMKVDLTVRAANPGWKYLNDEGYTGPPLLLVIAPDGTTVFKSNAYTSGEVAQAIAAARGKKVADATRAK